MFINSLKASESHYNRKKSRRLYLPSELNISKLCKMYNAKSEANNRVTYSFFAKIFNNCFNIGFGRPATDVCSLCCRLKNAIKSASTDGIRQKNITDLRIHRLRAKQFANMMKEREEGTVSICYDMQQVQPLPKLPISEAFYSHQISYYNICFMDLKKSHPSMYTWTENQAKRGSTEVGSALLDFLRKYDFPPNCTKLRLFSDGCGGQNKNCHIIHVLTYWLYKEAPKHLKMILLIFPVRGHSYLAADRVFGRVEKELRAQSTILHKDDYLNIYKNHGTVRQLGTDWNLYNIKELLPRMKKMDGILDMKRIFLQKTIDKKTDKKKKGKRTGAIRQETETVNFKMEPCYRNDDLSKAYANVLKEGKSIHSFNLNQLPAVQLIPAKKLKTIIPLMKAYNENWEQDDEYAWYQQVLLDKENRSLRQDDTQEEAVNEDSEDEEVVCDCAAEDCGLKI